MTWVAQRQELMEILRQKCREKDLRVRLEFQEKALRKLDMLRRSSSNFGNAGAVENLLKSAMCLGCSCVQNRATTELHFPRLCQCEELCPVDFRLKASARGGPVAKMIGECWNEQIFGPTCPAKQSCSISGNDVSLLPDDIELGPEADSQEAIADLQHPCIAMGRCVALFWCFPKLSRIPSRLWTSCTVWRKWRSFDANFCTV